jgi:hypothetical protein
MYGYKAVRTDRGGQVEFTLACFCGSGLSVNEATVNAHIFALYAATGEIQERFIVR